MEIGNRGNKCKVNIKILIEHSFFLNIMSLTLLLSKKWIYALEQVNYNFILLYELTLFNQLV